MMIRVSIVFIAIGLNLGGQESGTAALDSAISTLENWRKSYTRADLQAAVRVIRTEAPAGDEGVHARLLRVLRDATLPKSVRMEALRLICEKASAQTAPAILSLLESWRNTLARGEGGGVYAPEFDLLHIFVIDGAERLQSVAADQQRLLWVLKPVATSFVFPEAASKAARLIANSPAPIEMRRSCALEIVREARSSTQISGTILQLLDASSFPALREMVRQSPDADHFHYSAASALARHGDREILPELEAWRPKLRAKSRNFEGYVKGYIWKINIQHPPGGLLKYIASTDEPRWVEVRMWAIQRAVELGLPKADIRDAILTHAKQVKPNEHGIRPGLASLKKRGLRLHVLRPEDLSDVIMLEFSHSP